jgi:5-methylcytosine-specific restriction endonuclease McrA
MIFVDRSRVPVPKSLQSARAQNGRAAAESYFSIPRSERLQERFAFDSSIWASLRSELVDLFYSKCAFCESSIGATTNGEVEHFRPKTPVSGQHWSSRSLFKTKDKELRDGYWWLAYAWENLYFICPICNRNKANNFPIRGPRAKPAATGALGAVWVLR